MNDIEQHPNWGALKCKQSQFCYGPTGAVLLHLGGHHASHEASLFHTWQASEDNAIFFIMQSSIEVGPCNYDKVSDRKPTFWLIGPASRPLASQTSFSRMFFSTSLRLRLSRAPQPASPAPAPALRSCSGGETARAGAEGDFGWKGWTVSPKIAWLSLAISRDICYSLGEK